MLRLLLLVALAGKCDEPVPPSRTPPAPGCRPDVLMVVQGPVQPCPWVWRCGSETIPFDPPATLTGCTTAVF